MLNFTVIITCQLQKGAEITHCNKNFRALANRTYLGFVKGDSIDYCFLSTLIIVENTLSILQFFYVFIAMFRRFYEFYYKSL